MNQKNKDIRAEYYSKHCLVCNRRGCDPCHIKTFGSGGVDEYWNLMPLCRAHHTEQHQIGIISFYKKYPTVALYMEANGWKIEIMSSKPKLMRID